MGDPFIRIIVEFSLKISFMGKKQFRWFLPGNRLYPYFGVFRVKKFWSVSARTQKFIFRSNNNYDQKTKVVC